LKLYKRKIRNSQAPRNNNNKKRPQKKLFKFASLSEVEIDQIITTKDIIKSKLYQKEGKTKKNEASQFFNASKASREGTDSVIISDSFDRSMHLPIEKF
jgi:hypothetical protein